MENGVRPNPAYLATLDRPSLVRLAELLDLRPSKGKSRNQLIRLLATPAPPVLATPARRSLAIASPAIAAAWHPTPARRSLAVASPAIAAAWHPTKNGDLVPTDVSARSAQRVWWRCAKDPSHAWEAPICSRTERSRCPHCATLRARFPAIAAEWHPTRNQPLSPDTVGACSNRKVWWRCSAGHVSQTVVANRTMHGVDCQACGRGYVSLEARHPELAAAWHPAKNGRRRPALVSAISRVRVFWRCTAESTHPAWRASVVSRAEEGQGCPACVALTRSVATRFPALAKEWHPTSTTMIEGGTDDLNDVILARFGPGAEGGRERRRDRNGGLQKSNGLKCPQKRELRRATAGVMVKPHG